MNFPVKYRNHRKLVHVKIAMALSWIISAILWGPWVIWQMVDPSQQPPANKCYVKAIFDNPAIGLATSAGRFIYLDLNSLIIYHSQAHSIFLPRQWCSYMPRSTWQSQPAKSNNLWIYTIRNNINNFLFKYLFGILFVDINFKKKLKSERYHFRRFKALEISLFNKTKI